MVGPPGDASSTSWVPKPREAQESVIDCHGNKRGRLSIRKSNITVRNCLIMGDVRIWGIARNASAPELKPLSRKSDYVSVVRAAAPAHTTIENCTIQSVGTIPLYIGPGSTFTTIRNSKIIGTSKSTMIYIGAETHKTTITDSLIDATQADREAIAVDASSYNVIKGNTILHRQGGVYLYRNCGEAGVIRHTTPSHNLIEGNLFKGSGVAVWLGSREGNRCYCESDKGWPLGSSASDMDHSRFNKVLRNQLGGALIKVGKYGRQNEIQ